MVRDNVDYYNVQSHFFDKAVEFTHNAIGVPLFYTVEALRGFNDFLQAMNIHILYKPHFAQDMSVVRKESLSNFHIINDKDILGRDLQLYEVLAQSEALIMDYSSVFWDYMLLDRPIAITTDDIDIYKKQRGIFDFIDEVHEEAT